MIALLINLGHHIEQKQINWMPANTIDNDDIDRYIEERERSEVKR